MSKDTKRSKNFFNGKAYLRDGYKLKSDVRLKSMFIREMVLKDIEAVLPLYITTSKKIAVGMKIRRQSEFIRY